MLTDRISPRRLTLLVAALALFALAAVRFAHPTPSAADPSLDTQETQFLALLNNYRESQGLGDLVPQGDLNAAADWYATDMATKNYYGGATPNGNFCAQFNEEAHCDSLGRLPGARLTAFGYPPSTAGENIAAGFGDAQSVFDGWKASLAHNANMLYSGYAAIGIGWDCNSHADYECYWVTDFGSYAGPPSSNVPTPSPAPTVTSQPTPTATPTSLPTDTPSPTPTATPTSLPTDTPSATPVPTATPDLHTWGDVNCDGAITPEDAIDVLRGKAGVPEKHAGCPTVGDLVFIGGAYHVWGDTACTGGVDALDGIQLLQYVVGLSPGIVDPNCPAPGAPV
jgi:uncharacterized protein YkwD